MSTVSEFDPVLDSVLKLRRMVGGSVAFQKAVGAPNAAQARQRVHVSDVRGIVQRPFAIVEPGAIRWTSDKTGGGSRIALLPEGSLTLYLEVDRNPRYGEDHTKAALEAGRWFGRVLNEVGAQSAFDELLVIRSIDGSQWGELAPDDAEDDDRFFALIAEIEWGN